MIRQDSDDKDKWLATYVDKREMTFLSWLRSLKRKAAGMLWYTDLNISRRHHEQLRYVTWCKISTSDHKEHVLSLILNINFNIDNYLRFEDLRFDDFLFFALEVEVSILSGTSYRNIPNTSQDHLQHLGPEVQMELPPNCLFRQM